MNTWAKNTNWSNTEVDLLLNEKSEIKSLLDGERIDKKYVYRSCYLLAKYFKEIGHDKIKTREEIFSWANKYKIFITDELNSIIQRAFNDKHSLTDHVEIKISKNDIGEINKRFDKYLTKLTAFAILCFAKKYADKNGTFYMSRIGLSNWIGIDQSNLFNRYIKELIDFEYIEKVSKNTIKQINRRNKQVSKMLMYKINVDFKNEGDFLFCDSDIKTEFDGILKNNS